MGLNNLSVATVGTTLTVGTNPIDFVSDGAAVPGGLHLISTEMSDSGLPMWAMTVRNRPAVMDPKTGVFGKAKRSISVATPSVLTGGRVVFNTIRIEQEVHPLCSNSMASALREIAAQMAFVAGPAENFWRYGGLD